MNRDGEASAFRLPWYFGILSKAEIAVSTSAVSINTKSTDPQSLDNNTDIE